MQRALSKAASKGLGAALAVLLAAACQTSEGEVAGIPQFSHTANGFSDHITLCKTGSDATFEVVVDGGVAETVSLLDGECAELATDPGEVIFVTITETSSPNATLDSIVEERYIDGTGFAGVTNKVTDDDSITTRLGPDIGHVVTFYNTGLALGRMTGGGGQIILGDVRVTKGLTLHCDITLSNNLEINWPDNKWHLEKESLTNVECIDNPLIDPEPPAAPFDTFTADAIGSLNGVDGSYIRFTFVDAGEPGGKADMAGIWIWAVGANPATDPPYLEVPLMPTDNGNLQAHWDQPHGNKPVK